MSLLIAGGSGMRKAEYLFVLYNGAMPWQCYGCGEPIITIDSKLVVIHHKNENPKDNRKRNLVAMHRACHTRHHHRGVKRDPSVGKKIAAKKNDWTPEQRERHRRAMASPETGRKISAALKGRKFSDETRKKMSESAKKRKPVSAETRAKISAAGKGRKQSAEERQQRSEAALRRWRREKGLEE